MVVDAEKPDSHQGTLEEERRSGSNAGSSSAFLSSIFSVPPKSAPNSGIYAMEKELEGVDLEGSGKVLGLDPKYWIKDIDTGKVYSLEDTKRMESSADDADNAAGPSKGPMEQGYHGKAADIQVSDILTGESLALKDFESSMGYRGHAMSPEIAMEDRAVPNPAIVRSGVRWFHETMSRLGLRRHVPSEASDSPVQRSLSSASSPVQDSLGLKVKVLTSRKNFKEFSGLRLVQSIYAHEGVIWVAKFSKSGRYLATAGQDTNVIVWKVDTNRSTSANRGKDDEVPEGEESSLVGQHESIEAPGVVYGVPVLNTTPFRHYKGHKKDVLDLSWSGSNFLFSASMDKTVRLWHISVAECLKVFRHNDFVTSIAVHPLNETLFLSGSIDGKVRLWNVPEARVSSWQDIHDMVTAVTFSRDGNKAVVGSMRGKCRFYSLGISNTLEYDAQLDVKNKRGQHSRGKKITGLTFAPKLFPNALLITSNDSRIRLYDGFTLRFKYKGLANKSTQIKASFSPKGNFVICGSDDGAVYIWDCSKSPIPGKPTLPTSASRTGSPNLVERTIETISEPFIKEKNSSWESFQVSDDVVTSAIFAPEAVQLKPVSPEKAKYAAFGQVILTCGYKGEIKIYENTGTPQWL